MRTARGFTLIELMITVLIASVAVAAVGSVFLTQVQLYQRHEGRRGSQSSARASLSFLEDRLRTAGYGVDPGLAFVAFDSYNPASDASATGYPDAVAVHARDSVFSERQISGAGAGSIDFAPPLLEPLEVGQIVLAVCSGGARYAYGIVGSRALAGATSVSLGGSAAAEGPRGLPGPRFDQQATLGGACFNDGSAVMVKVDRAAFYVDSFDDDRITANANVPYLMLHRGIDINNDGSVDENDGVPLATGVEQLQLAYILHTNDATAPEVATAPPYGDTWAQTAGGPDFVDDFYRDPARLVSHPANIRQVRLTVVARGMTRDPNAPGDDATTAALENLGVPALPEFTPQGGGFARTVLRLSVAPKNLLMRTQFQSPATGGG